jgi:hypothetical protein
MNKAYSSIIVLAVITLMLLTACGPAPLPEVSEPPAIEPVETPVSVESPEPEYISMKPLARSDYSYITSMNDEVIEDDISYDVPGFVDLVSFSKHIDDESIVINLGLRELPLEFAINQGGAAGGSLEYSWRINFDTGSDGGLEYDITLAHHRFAERGAEMSMVPVDGSDFVTMAHQHQVTSGKDIAEGTISIEGNTMSLRFEKSGAEELLGIKEDTPIHILIEYWGPDFYLYEIIP